MIESPRFPDVLARDARRIRRTRTEIVATSGGHETRSKYWAQKLRRWDVGVAIKTQADYDLIIPWFEALDGPFVAFRFRDPHEHATTHADGVLIGLHGYTQVGAAGFGYGVPSYQLARSYAVGAATHRRDIRKPVAGAEFKRASSVTSPTLSTVNGIATFAADQTRAISAHTPGASHQITLASAFSPNVTVGQRVYITGTTGTAATTLNDLSHAVTSVAGALIGIGTTTTGLTATGGTCALYPQASETLTWAGTFDVAARFESDELEDIIMQRRQNGEFLLQAPSLTIVEVRVLDDGSA